MEGNKATVKRYGRKQGSSKKIMKATVKKISKETSKQ